MWGVSVGFLWGSFPSLCPLLAPHAADHILPRALFSFKAFLDWITPVFFLIHCFAMKWKGVKGDFVVLFFLLGWNGPKFGRWATARPMKKPNWECLAWHCGPTCVAESCSFWIFIKGPLCTGSLRIENLFY